MLGAVEIWVEEDNITFGEEIATKATAQAAESS